MSDATYGMPRIRAELADMGIVASRKRIAHLMRAAKVAGVSRRRAWCVTTQRNQRQRPAPDLVNRQFVAQDINQLWVADMTYIPTWAGFVYLAVVTDVFSRKVVGWVFGEHMTADLVIAALNMALLTRKPESVIHHSDQGSQYTSLAFGQMSPNNFERKHAQQQKETLPAAPAQALEHGLPTGCCAPVHNPPHVPAKGTSGYEQAGPVDKPALLAHNHPETENL